MAREDAAPSQRAGISTNMTRGDGSPLYTCTVTASSKLRPPDRQTDRQTPVLYVRTKERTSCSVRRSSNCVLHTALVKTSGSNSNRCGALRPHLSPQLRRPREPTIGPEFSTGSSPPPRTSGQPHKEPWRAGTPSRLVRPDDDEIGET